jgi:prepilin-type N-terminal cleavage/methylation domain-containing protein
MADSPCRTRSGFTLVEMMIALVFTGVLMAGMAGVFRADVANAYTTSERTGSLRRNRLALDLLYDDVNSAGVFIQDLTSAPAFSSANPGFYILPSQSVANFTVDGQQQYADQLFFYMDQPLPFIGTLTASNGASDARNVSTGTAYNAADTQFGVDCSAPVYAGQVSSTLQAGLPLWVTFMDQWDPRAVTGLVAPVAAGAQVITIQTGADTTSAYTSRGYAGNEHFPHNQNSAVLFFIPGQMVRYSIQMLKLDPNPSTPNSFLPCLVRDQGTYSGSGFTPNPNLPQQVITENVSAFRCWISSAPAWLAQHQPNMTWAPFNAVGNDQGVGTGWTNGVLADFNTQLGMTAAAGVTSTSAPAVVSGSGQAWFRSIPAVLRLDITTRTALARSEYSATPSTSTAYATITQSLIVEPRNFGLPLY